ncbi:hypothetical protein [Terasakiella pusilla]|uniref:hypothetical protein n=1 Tax=Terasakiella pusilla TaxID=64973 RepID=UPI003AA926E5
MGYWDDQVAQIWADLYQVQGKFNQLQESFVVREYRNNKSAEYAKHGFCRRIRMLVRCIDNIFISVPPDIAGRPDEEVLYDLTINLQTFVFHVFGCVDNLAWVLVEELGIVKEDGTPLSRFSVGLRPNHRRVRAYLSDEFQQFLQEIEEWFSVLEDFRHALAHRIPLYVPPYVVQERNHVKYQELEDRCLEASRLGNIEEYNRLHEEQMALTVFSPVMTHSIFEGSYRVWFHAQVLADFNTIDALAKKVLAELDR